MYKNIVLIHGIGGLHREIYFDHLKTTFENLGLNVYMPSLGGYRDNTTYVSWEKYFDEKILPILNENTIVIAQSMGTQFAVKYIAKRKLNVGMYISTAGPGNILDMKPEIGEKIKLFEPVSKQFKPTKEERDIFKSLTFEKYSFYSNNDTFFVQENLEQYVKDIGSIPMFIENRAHFNTDDLVNGFLELEDFIKNKLN